MFRKRIITLAAAATLGVAALASGPASAHWGGHWGGRWGGGHRMWAFHRVAYHPRYFAYHPRFFVRRFAFRHPYFVRRHFVLIGRPILLDGCWRVYRVPTYWGWRWRRVWVCG